MWTLKNRSPPFKSGGGGTVHSVRGVLAKFRGPRKIVARGPLVSYPNGAPDGEGFFRYFKGVSWPQESALPAIFLLYDK
jgi:hypothetical protein